MRQLELFTIPSPCLRICQAGSSGLCVGCFRTRKERLNWHQFNPEEQRAVLKKCAYRKVQAIRAQRRLPAEAQTTASEAPREADFFTE